MKARNFAFSAGFMALAVLAGCSSLPAAKPAAQAMLEPSSGSQVRGTVSFTPMGDKLLVEADLSGLTPGEHGFHEIGRAHV